MIVSEHSLIYRPLLHYYHYYFMCDPVPDHVHRDAVLIILLDVRVVWNPVLSYVIIPMWDISAMKWHSLTCVQHISCLSMVNIFFRIPSCFGKLWTGQGYIIHKWASSMYSVHGLVFGKGFGKVSMTVVFQRNSIWNQCIAHVHCNAVSWMSVVVFQGKRLNRHKKRQRRTFVLLLVLLKKCWNTWTMIKCPLFFLNLVGI